MKNSALITGAGAFAGEAVSQGSIVQPASGTTRKKNKNNMANAGYIRNLALAIISALTIEEHSLVYSVINIIRVLFLDLTNRQNALSDSYSYAHLPELNKLKE
ncbi:hypothetical protein [Pedobacter hartonius]|uniref:Uncharacterized protein n=1 Tax=Pedobacter hartonius TaxID=425514 RepID=A0A1H4AQ10_9SPHI|nr:hypothetical protein [Pedobacter hartonius]SEA37802.1 hypothetical protein SAMN05443550_10353 [Pedobacter hartonius]